MWRHGRVRHFVFIICTLYPVHAIHSTWLGAVEYELGFILVEIYRSDFNMFVNSSSYHVSVDVISSVGKPFSLK